MSSHITRHHDKYRYDGRTLFLTTPIRRIEIVDNVHEHEIYRYFHCFASGSQTHDNGRSLRGGSIYICIYYTSGECNKICFSFYVCVYNVSIQQHTLSACCWNKYNLDQLYCNQHVAVYLVCSGMGSRFVSRSPTTELGSCSASQGRMSSVVYIASNN